MFLHLGHNFVVRKKDIIGIFDLDKTTVSPRTRAYLAAKEKQKKIISDGEALPQSFIITHHHDEKVFLSSVTAKTLARRKVMTEEV